HVRNHPLVVPTVAGQHLHPVRTGVLHRDGSVSRHFPDLLDRGTTCSFGDHDLVHAQAVVAQRFQNRLAAVDGDETILGGNIAGHRSSVTWRCFVPRPRASLCQDAVMPDRLSAVDASFLYLEDDTTPMHVGGVAIFRSQRSGLDYDKVLSLIDRRLNLVPRYRQRVLQVPGRLARPVWVDDQDFDLTYHVRRSALPRPGNDEQLHELVARLMSRKLDQSRPLWEIYLVEGLSRNRTAVITKTHQAMIDGIAAVDIAQMILDTERDSEVAEGDVLWMPRPQPGTVQLLADAAADAVQRPGEIVENARATLADVTATARKVSRALDGVVSALRAAVFPAPSGPLNSPTSAQRRFAVARAKLDDLRAIRRGNTATINDVVLAIVTTALRNWLLSRGEVVNLGTTVRAMVPVSVRSGDAESRRSYSETGTFPPDAVGNKVSAFFVDLPVG